MSKAWDSLVDFGKQFLVISAVLGVLSTAAVNITRPFWEPFASIPEEITQIKLELQNNLDDIRQISDRISNSLTPQVVEFDGPGVIVNEGLVVRGGDLTLVYFLKRNVDCRTEVEGIFYNVDTGIPYPGVPSQARRAPITNIFILFPVTVDVPDDIPPGRYIFSPFLNPEDCGIYGRIRVPLSEIFEVA